MSLTREQIRDGWVQHLVRSAGLETGVLNDEELRCSREQVLAGHQPGADVAVFAYGSLIWNPAFHFRAREIAHIHGFHRRFCLWTHLGRGSPERPGLVLGLDHGGSCRGVLYTVAAAEIDSELEIVWRREMVTAAYRPSWVVARTPSGPRRAITFLINHAHPRYAGQLAEPAIVDTLAHACGPLGHCAEYLFRTTEHLEELGIVDRSLLRLARLVRETQACQGQPLAGGLTAPA